MNVGQEAVRETDQAKGEREVVIATVYETK